MTRKEEALRIFDSGFNCSQAVLGAFCEELDTDELKYKNEIHGTTHDG